MPVDQQRHRPGRDPAGWLKAMAMATEAGRIACGLAALPCAKEARGQFSVQGLGRPGGGERITSHPPSMPIRQRTPCLLLPSLSGGSAMSVTREDGAA